MSKRLFEVINEKSPSLLIQSTPEQVKQLVADIIEANARKKNLTEEERIEDLIEELEHSYELICFGEDWKSDKTREAVREFENLDFDDVAEALLELDNLELQWKLAARFTETAAFIIVDASEEASKLVNGSAGEWCPDKAAVVTGLWEALMSAGKYPSDALFEEISGRLCGCSRRLWGSGFPEAISAQVGSVYSSVPLRSRTVA